MAQSAGELLAEWADLHHLDPEVVAQRVGISVGQFEGLVAGVVAVTPDLAEQLRAVTGISTQVWLGVEASQSGDHPQWRKGDRVQDDEWGVVGTVDLVYSLAGIGLIDVVWDPSTFRADDSTIRPFDQDAEDKRIAKSLQGARSTGRSMPVPLPHDLKSI